jgi:hypothetical protein
MRALFRGVVLAGLASSAAAFDHARVAEIELKGPLSNVVLQAAGGGRTRIEGALAAGETRVLAVPIAQPDGASSAPTITFDVEPDPARASGAARFLRWREKSGAFTRLSPGLRARARPALAETVVEVSRAAPLVLLVAAIVVVSTRRRPLVALAVALGASGALIPLVRAPARDLEASVTLVDGDAAAGVWRRVDAALDALALPSDELEFTLDVDPAHASVVWHVALDRTEPLRARSPRARLFVTRGIEVADGLLSRARNGYAAFDDAWFREDGVWKHVGPWPLGAPLPAPAAESAPPAWLASSLPQGVTILVARERGDSARAARFVRVSGL